MKLSPKHFIKILHCSFRNMTGDKLRASILMPPMNVRGMLLLDRERFRKTICVPVLKIPTSEIKIIIKHLKPFMLKMEHLRPLRVNTDSENTRELLLRPDLVFNWKNLPEEMLRACKVNEENFSFEQIELTYDNWGAKDIFRSVLPENEEGLSSFSIIGHIVHVNIRSHLLAYKQLIGQVLLDKIPNCRTVVNKTAIIENVYRFFQFERLAGEANYVVETKENGYVFSLDFSQVYWNPRLSSEHERIYKTLHKNDTVYDVFAGVGPFVVPAACRGCRVFANDLNPESIRWLNHNIKLNHAKAELVQTYNLDGREFILNVVKKDLICLFKRETSTNDIYIIMNLPALAITFLDAFRGLLQLEEHEIDFDRPSFRYPLIHSYTFAKINDPECIENIKLEIEERLGMPLDHNLIDIKFVRNVAPQKNMFRVSFRLNKMMLTTSREVKNGITNINDTKSKTILKRAHDLSPNITNTEEKSETNAFSKKQCGIRSTS